MDEKQIRVVAALIRKDKKVLITERWPNKHMGLTWEFPGGKVEFGESDEAALKRELMEELGIEVKVGSCCFQTTYSYSNKEVNLSIFRCEITEGTPQALDVKSLEWVLQSELNLRPFPPADLIFVQELVADNVPEDVFEEESEPEFKPAQILRRVSLTSSQGQL
ncbi:MAG: (deoxy)nucleoside triphosphate pyrophosphohydrolase [Myxococcaceae bacterium]